MAYILVVRLRSRNLVEPMPIVSPARLTSAHILGVVALGGVLVGTTGCHRLPDVIPYEAHVGEEGNPAGVYRITELAGAELKLDGQPIGKLETGNTKISVNTKWTTPKDKLRPTLNGTYTIAVPGACGPYDLPTEGPNALWREMSDSKLAEIIDRDKNLPIYIRLKMPSEHEVYVDWGDSKSSTVMVGPVKIPAGQKTTKLTLEGCKAPPSVFVDGKAVGELDPKGKASLVNVDPSTCHVLQEVSYGDQRAKTAPTFYPAKGVVPVANPPSYALESAPSEVKIRGKGLTMTELVRANCR